MMRQYDHVPHFELWAQSKGLNAEDEQYQLCKEAWNLAVEIAADIVGENEGIDYGIVDMLFVETEE